MDQQIIDFLNKERVGSLTTVLENGQPHSATMHFSISNDPFELYFSTDKTTRKLSNFSNTNKAAFLIGFSEAEWKTLQVEGHLELVSNEEITKIKEIHYAKNPRSKRFEDDPNTVFLRFIPLWWRYSDFMTKPMTVLSSEG